LEKEKVHKIKRHRFNLFLNVGLIDQKLNFKLENHHYYKAKIYKKVSPQIFNLKEKLYINFNKIHKN
jgi:hypothetical protein